MASILEQYRISDFLEWYKDGRLSLNPDFQRGSVWTPVARSFLIDTVLQQLPIPKIYLRTNIDILTKKSVREVVDGQQRLRAIIDFGNDKLLLGKRAGDFDGFVYSTLSPELQQAFLSYPIAVDQLLNASDDDVLEVFARLNSYSVQLNAPEKRHAAFQGEFKWSVRQSSRSWQSLWDEYHVVSVRQRVRMEDDSLIAEMYGILLDGVCDGGQTNIDKLYKKYDPTFDLQGDTSTKLDSVLRLIIDNFASVLKGTPVLSAPHFLMLFAAVALATEGIPKSDDVIVPDKDKTALSNFSMARSNLQQIAAIIDSDSPLPGYEEFWKASKSSTQRISSRKVRFPVYYRALLPKPLKP